MLKQSVATKVLAHVQTNIKSPLALSIAIASLLGDRINRKYKKVLADEIKKSTPNELKDIVKELNMELGEDFGDLLLEQGVDDLEDFTEELEEEVADNDDLKDVNLSKVLKVDQLADSVHQAIEANEEMNDFLAELWGKEEAAKIREVSKTIDINNQRLKELQKGLFTLIHPNLNADRKKDVIYMIDDFIDDITKQKASYRIQANQRSSFNYYTRAIAKIDQHNISIEKLLNSTEFMAKQGVEKIYKLAKAFGYSNQQLAKIKELHTKYVDITKKLHNYFSKFEAI